MSSSARIGGKDLLTALLPTLFVVLWSTGFIGMKLGVSGAGTMTFLALRFAISVTVLYTACVLMRVRWRVTPAAVGHAMVVGALLHGVYIGSVGEALAHGVSAGAVALVAGLQPLVTAAFVGRLLGEAVSPLQWLGLALGFAGVGLVVFAKLAVGEATLAGFGFTALCLAGITAGTLYQKKFCTDHDMMTSMTIQFATAAALTFAGALLFEDFSIVWSGAFVAALLWLAIVTSIGAFALLFVLLRRGRAARVTSLFYLTPPTTAVMAYALFGETLGCLAIAGMAVAAAGVALANR